MTQGRKSGLVVHMVWVAAVSLGVVATVGLLVPSPQREVIATATAEPVDTGGIPLRPSYVVRDAPLPSAAPAEPIPARVSLSVQPLATIAPPEPVAEKWYVNAGALNVRAGPSSSSGQLAALPMGTEVEIIGTEGKWSEIATADGLQGWAFTKYLSQTAPH
jgi:uncharacterized protein YgiM (DUF1202 family)